MCLLLGTFTGARAQTVLSDPNQIAGTIGWNNPPGPVRSYLDSSAPSHGLAAGTVFASQMGGGFAANTTVADDPGHLSVGYSITVQAGPAPGIQYYVWPIMTLEDGHRYIFGAGLTPTGVQPEPAIDVPVDLTECAGLIELRFVDVAGNPVTVEGGNLSAQLGPPTWEEQARGNFGSVSSVRLAVRGGNTFNVAASFYQTSGSDFFSDYLSVSYANTYTVTVACDEIVVVQFLVPPSPIGSGGGGGGGIGTVGSIFGNVDMVGEDEHWFYHRNTKMNALDGPQGNFRYAEVGLLTQPGHLPYPAASPVTGTSAHNSSGPFVLANLLPSDFSAPPNLPKDYQVYGELTFGLNRRYEWFRTPWRDGSNGRVPVVQGTPTDLGDTFVIHPGHVQGDIFMCGPEEVGSVQSFLRHIGRDIVDPELSYASVVSASGLDLPAAGATRTALGGRARALFEGDFMVAGPQKNHFVGDYRMALGGLNQEATRWDMRNLGLLFLNTATPADADNYLSSSVNIWNQQFQNVPITPAQIVQLDHRYGFSRVVVRFHATNGALFRPAVTGDGSFNGLNFESHPAQYFVEFQGSGTPTTSLADASNNGQVVLGLPEGDYTLHPTVYSVNPDGINISLNTLAALNITVGPCEVVEVSPGLVLNVDTIPECVAQPQLTVSGAVTSTTNVASITYTLNGDTVTVCTGCGVSPAFNFTATLAACDNMLQITATDVQGNISSRTRTIRFDDTPPVLTCAAPKTVACGTAWNFDEPTALDACSGSVIVTVLNTVTTGTCPQTSTRTWQATDACGNSATCSQVVTVQDSTPPVTCGLTGLLSADGTTVTYRFAGALSAAFGTLPAGTPFTGSFSYAAVQPSLNVGDTTRGDYLYQSFSVTIANTTLTANGIGGGIFIYDSASYPDDLFHLNAGVANSPSLGGLTVEVMTIVLQDLTGTAWTSTALIGPGLTLANFTQGPSIPTYFRLLSTPAGPFGDFVDLRSPLLICDTPPPTPLVLTCAPGKTVECGTAWTFDEPTVTSGSCAVGNVTLTVLSTVTTGTCPQTSTRTWQATDGCGNSATCSQTVTVLAPPDADGDGVPDSSDNCPGSILTPTVVIAGCDTGVPNTVSANGCTIADLIAQCAAGTTDPCLFISCVASVTDSLLTQGAITDAEKAAILSCAGRNQAPSFTFNTAASDGTVTVTVKEDSGKYLLGAGFVTTSPGPASESTSQTVNYFNTVYVSNPGLFANSTAGQPHITATGELNFWPKANQNGSSTVTVRAHDTGGTACGGVNVSASQSFVITVTAVNDLPTLTPTPDPDAIFEDASEQTIILTGISPGAPADEAGQTVTITATSNNPGVVPDPTVSYTPGTWPATATLKYTPVPDQWGIALITVTVQDNGQSDGMNASQTRLDTFKVKVLAVNDAPSFYLKAAPDVTVPEDAIGLQTIVGQAIGKNGPPNEVTQLSQQHLVYTVHNDNPGLFTALGQPKIDQFGTLTFRLAPDMHGTATVTAQISDTGGTGNGGVDTSTAPPQSFLITVSPVNDAPTLTKVEKLTGAVSGMPFTITYAELATAADEADLEGDPISFLIDSIGSSGTLTKGGIPVTPGTTTLGAGESLVWTPTATNPGDKNAFGIKASDGMSSSTSSVNVRVTMAANALPTLTSVAPLTGAVAGTPFTFTITYAALAAAADEADLEGEPISFRVISVNTGTTLKTQGGQLVTTGTTSGTLLAPGGSLIWTSASASPGTKNAFTVRAWDGWGHSAPAVQVKVVVQ